jgi:hypothetical protein
MPGDWVRPLLLVYGALALFMILSLYLWVSSKMEWQGQSRKDRGARSRMECELASARAEIDALRANVCALEQSLRDLHETSGALVAPVPPRSGLNLNVRSQVLRRNRFGEPPAEIAAALCVPRAEVDLLLKVNRIVMENL